MPSPKSKPDMKKMMGAMMGSTKMPMEAPEMPMREGPVVQPKPKKKGKPGKGKSFNFTK